MDDIVVVFIEGGRQRGKTNRLLDTVTDRASRGYKSVLVGYGKGSLKYLRKSLREKILASQMNITHSTTDKDSMSNGSTVNYFTVGQSPSVHFRGFNTNEVSLFMDDCEYSRHLYMQWLHHWPHWREIVATRCTGIDAAPLTKELYNSDLV